MLDSAQEKQIRMVLELAPQKIVLSNPIDKVNIYRKIVLSQILLKDNVVYQAELFTQKQVFHENVEIKQMADYVIEKFSLSYQQMNVFDEAVQWDFKLTKKGKLLHKQHGTVETKKTASLVRSDKMNDKTINIEETQIRTHNRQKNYLLKEGMIIPPLVDLGIFTKDGKIVRTMYDKYKQINRFLELVEDVVKDYPNKNMHIIDFGCGKSYLTFILYYYLVQVKGYQVRMTGLDLKEDVIQKCNATARKYHYENLRFELGDINGYKTEDAVDMVVTLHACDAATDYALYNAINWNAGIILSVPCCQKEVNGQVLSERLSLFTKYGVVKERISALMTDAIRANVLEYCGYKTQMLEFVDFASSPKNILIRAVRGNVSAAKKERAKKEIQQVCEEFHVKQTLVDLVIREDSAS